MTMDAYTKTLKRRVWSAVLLAVLGIILIIFANFTATQNEFIWIYGTSLAVCGAVKAGRLWTLTKDEKRIKSARIVENDERNLAIASKARGVAFVAFALLSAVAIAVLSVLKMDDAATAIAISVCVLSLIYTVAYKILQKIE